MNYLDETMEHIWEVGRNIMVFASELKIRGKNHDESKLNEPEASRFAEVIPLLKKSTYGSDEYKGFLKELGPALDHHYANNRHHPEFHQLYECNGCFKVFEEIPDHCDVCWYSQFTKKPSISGMNLIDIIEMFCDWIVAVKRHDGGNIFKSIEINKKRFALSDQLADIFINTAKEVFGESKE